ncbi:unnamed protein product [Prunus armeniaca]
MCASCLEFRCGTVDSNYGTATCLEGNVALATGSVGMVPNATIAERDFIPHEMLSCRSVIQLMEGLNLGPSVRVHSEADVGEVRRSLRVDVRRDARALRLPCLACCQSPTSESSVEAISDESLRHSRRFLTRSNGRSGDFRHSERQAGRIPTKTIGNIVRDLYRARFKMSDSESLYEGEPNAFEGESSDGLFDSKSEGTENIGAEDGEDTDVEIIGEVTTSVPTHGIGKGLMVRQPEPLAAIFCDGSHFGVNIDGESSTARQSETSTSGRGEAAVEPSSHPRVSVVYHSNPKVPMGVPKEHLFGVDYLVPNKITEWEIAKYRVKYRIPDSVKMRIPGATETLSRPKDGEVVFFTDVLIQGVRLPLQLAVQRILAQINYAPGQFNHKAGGSSPPSST